MIVSRHADIGLTFEFARRIDRKHWEAFWMYYYCD